MPVTEKFALGISSVLIGGDMTNLASSATLSAGALSTMVYNNTIGGGNGDGYTLALLELFVSGFAAAPAAGTAMYVYFLTSMDGITYEDGSASVIPARPPDAIFPFRAAAGNQRIILRGVPLFPGMITTLVTQNSGQAIPINSQIRVRPYTRQGV